MAGCFEFGNEPSAFVECGDFFFDSLRTISLSSSGPTVLRVVS